jgi:hypothetical protein
MIAWKTMAVLALSAALCGEARAGETSKHGVRIPEPSPAALRESIPRAKAAACVNLAAMRALEAKAQGADYPAQDRLLGLAFALCMAGTVVEG